MSPETATVAILVALTSAVVHLVQMMGLGKLVCSG